MRIIQNLVSMRYIERLLQQYGKNVSRKVTQRVFVTKTHYNFHPKACYDRIIQNLVSMRDIERLLQHYGKKVSI